MKEFKVNEYITLKFEGGKTNIYVKGILFNQCKFLLLNIPVEKISSFDEIDSIDDAAERLDNSLEGEFREGGDISIPYETEFWGHCSNLQVWAEMNYDTRLLYRTIAFPLLKLLSEFGDSVAKVRFKEEVVKRFKSGNLTVINFLIEGRYLEVLQNEERELIYLENNPKLKKRFDIFPSERKVLSIFNTLAKMGDQYAKGKLEKYSLSIKQRKPLPLDIDLFWDIIKRAREQSNGDQRLQEELIINELITYSLEDILIFEEVFSIFTSKLRNNEGLARELVKNLEIFLSDDGWYYLCLGVVGLGKELYEMALFEAPKFIELVKSGKFGKPYNLGYEFYAIIYKVMDNLMGSSQLDDIWALEEKFNIKPIKEKIQNELNSWYINKLKTTINKKEPETIAYLAINDFFDDLPKDYLVEVLLDGDLFNIWIEKYFDFGIYSDHHLSKLGTSISDKIRDNIIESVKNNRLEDFLNFIGRGLFNNLNEKDFSIVVKNPNYNFFRILFEALRETKKHNYLFEIGLGFCDISKANRSFLLKEELLKYIEYVNRGDFKIDLNIFIKSRILNFIEGKELIPLFENKKLNLLENIIKLAEKDHFEFGEWFYYEFLKREGFTLSRSILKLINDIVENQDYDFFMIILRSPILDYLDEKDAYSLFKDPFSKFYKLLFKYVQSSDYLEEYFSLIPEKILKFNPELILNNFSIIIKNGNKEDLLAIFRLCITYKLNLDHIINIIFKNSKIEIVDFIIELRNEYYEEVEPWVDNYFGKLGSESVLKNYLIDTIKNEDHQKFIIFLENFLFGYIDNKNIIEIFEDEDIDFFDFLINSTKDLNPEEENILTYRRIFPPELIQHTSEIFLQKIEDLARLGSTERLFAFLRLQFIDSISIDNFISLIDKYNYVIMPALLRINPFEGEESFGKFFWRENISRFLRPLKKYLVYAASKGDLEETPKWIYDALQCMTEGEQITFLKNPVFSQDHLIRIAEIFLDWEDQYPEHLTAFLSEVYNKHLNEVRNLKGFRTIMPLYKKYRETLSPLEDKWFTSMDYDNYLSELITDNFPDLSSQDISELKHNIEKVYRNDKREKAAEN